MKALRGRGDELWGTEWGVLWSPSLSGPGPWMPVESLCLEWLDEALLP